MKNRSGVLIFFRILLFHMLHDLIDFRDQVFDDGSGRHGKDHSGDPCDQTAEQDHNNRFKRSQSDRSADK